MGKGTVRFIFLFRTTDFYQYALCTGKVLAMQMRKEYNFAAFLLKGNDLLDLNVKGSLQVLGDRKEVRLGHR